MGQGQWQMQREQHVCCEICGSNLQEMPGMQHYNVQHRSESCIGKIYREKRDEVEKLQGDAHPKHDQKRKQAKKECADAKRKHGDVLRILKALRRMLDDKDVIYTAEKGFTLDDKAIDVAEEVGNRLGT